MKELKLNLIYDMGAFANTASPFLTGFILDRFGPKKTNFLGAILFITGLLLFCCSFLTGINLFAVGFALLGFSGTTISLSLFHLSNLIPNYEGLVMSGFSGLFSVSSLVFKVMLILYERGIKIEFLFFGFTLVLAPLFVLEILLQPNKPFEKQIIPTKVDIEHQPLVTPNERDFNKPMFSSVYNKPMLKQVFSPLYLLSALWIAILAFHPVFYSGNVVSILKNDMFQISLFNWIWSCGFFAIPIIGFILDRYGIGFSIFFVTITNFIFAVLSCFNSPGVSIATFVMASFANVILWSVEYMYIGNVFGYANFGKLLGISNLIVALIGLLQYPLVSFTVSHFGNNFLFSNGLLTILSFATFVFPIYYTIQYLLENRTPEGMENEERIN